MPTLRGGGNSASIYQQMDFFTSTQCESRSGANGIDCTALDAKQIAVGT
jgi:hypothetical protein